MTVKRYRKSSECLMCEKNRPKRQQINCFIVRVDHNKLRRSAASCFVLSEFMVSTTNVNGDTTSSYGRRLPTVLTACQSVRFHAYVYTVSGKKRPP